MTSSSSTPASSARCAVLGRGLRQFDVLPSKIELEVVRVIDTPDATHIHYRVRR
jgi:hypothetical protein